MSLINKEHLLQDLSAIEKEYKDFSNTPTFYAAVKTVREARAVDAVEVVRCKECIWGQVMARFDGLRHCQYMLTDAINNVVRDDEFCSRAITKEGGAPK